MRNLLFILVLLHSFITLPAQQPAELKFVRQGTKRMIFDADQSIILAQLNPAKIVGAASMHPVIQFAASSSNVKWQNNQLRIQSADPSETAIWMGGFNPFATYTLDIDSTKGSGELGFMHTEPRAEERVCITIRFSSNQITDVRLQVKREATILVDQSIKSVSNLPKKIGKSQLLVQWFGSGLTVYWKENGLPVPIGQSDIGDFIEMRSVGRFQAMQTHVYTKLDKSSVYFSNAEAALTTGVGQADIRAITYENGEPYLDKGRLWYTMSVRGRALPHHTQGVFSMHPSVFDLKLEGIILFDRNDGLLRNEIASHIFYDRRHQLWRGITTGFSAYAKPAEEKKQLLVVESRTDPRFGFSVMQAAPFGMVGDIEDPHILFDEHEKKWRILTCENNQGYKAILLESDQWNSGYKKIAGPVTQNSTGTSIQQIGDSLYCFSGSADRKIYIYSYPELAPRGVLQMDLPPWDSTSGTRVWPNIVQLPKGYATRYVALMMDRYNYPGISGPNWTYGALYLYHANDLEPVKK